MYNIEFTITYDLHYYDKDLSYTNFFRPVKGFSITSKRLLLSNVKKENIIMLYIT